MKPRLRILAFAYACEPNRGSEPGAGWNWARMLATLGEVWVITRANNRKSIEAQVGSLPNRERFHFVYVDLPRVSAWKRGNRGVRAYYLLWQLKALGVAKRLNREIEFDVVWHLTFANVWLGSVGGFVGPPFVFGPVGGGVQLPWSLWSALGVKGLGYEVVRSLTRSLHRHLNPMTRKAWSCAQVILANNPETVQWLPIEHREKTRVLQSTLIEMEIPSRSRVEPPGDGRQAPTQYRAIYAGRLVPWKGLRLGIEALTSLPEWILFICGQGPDEQRLKKLSRYYGVSDRIRFLGWRPHTEVHDLMTQCDAYLHPSLHDDAPFAVAEAIGAGLPVVCIDRGGSPIVVGDAGIRASPNGRPHDVAQRLANALHQVVQLPDRVVAKRASELTWLARAEELKGIIGLIHFADLHGREPDTL